MAGRDILDAWLQQLASHELATPSSNSQQPQIRNPIQQQPVTMTLRLPKFRPRPALYRRLRRWPAAAFPPSPPHCFLVGPSIHPSVQPAVLRRAVEWLALLPVPTIDAHLLVPAHSTRLSHQPNRFDRMLVDRGFANQSRTEPPLSCRRRPTSPALESIGRQAGGTIVHVLPKSSALSSSLLLLPFSFAHSFTCPFTRSHTRSFFNPVRPSSLLRELIQPLIINYTVTAILFFFCFFNFLSFLKKCVSPQSLPLPLPASPPSSLPAATASRAPTRCTRPWPKASRRQASSSTSSGRRAQPSSST